LNLTPSQLHILQHGLGVDEYGQGNQYRNHFVTGPESKDFADCQALVALGLMNDYGAKPCYGGMHAFNVTTHGMDEVRMQSPPPPKLSRGAQRYRDYLDADSGLTFIEWLKARTRQPA